MSKRRPQEEEVKYNSAPNRGRVGLGQNTSSLLKQFAKDEQEDIDREPDSSSDEASQPILKSSSPKSPRSSQSQEINSQESVKKRKTYHEDNSWIYNQTRKVKQSKKYGQASLMLNQYAARSKSKPVTPNIHALPQDSPSADSKETSSKKTNERRAGMRIPTAPLAVSTVTAVPARVKAKFQVPVVATSLADQENAINTKERIVPTTRTKMRIPGDASGQSIQQTSSPLSATKSKATMQIPEMPPKCVSETNSLNLPDLSVGSTRSRAQSVASNASDLSDLSLAELSDPDPGLFENYKCPACAKVVTQQFYNDWTARHPIILYKDKKRFCEEHTKRSALETWTKNGYPSMSWGTFNVRLKEYMPVVQQVIDKPEESFFRIQLQDAVDRGQSRTLSKRGEEDHKSPVGYYGVVGLRAMSSMISYEFAARLRSLALTDSIIAARDPSGYIDMVLVPELASRLIMDDMHVDITKAREIMDESHAVGDIINGVDSANAR